MFMRPTFPGSQRSMQTPQADCALEPLERMHFTAPLAGITCHRSGCSAAMIVEVRACCVKVDESVCVCCFVVDLSRNFAYHCFSTGRANLSLDARGRGPRLRKQQSQSSGRNL